MRALNQHSTERIRRGVFAALVAVVLAGGLWGFGAAFAESPGVDAGTDASDTSTGDATAARTAPDAGSRSDVEPRTDVDAEAADTGLRRPRPSPSADKLLEEADSIERQVARIRGLPTLRPIDKGVKRRDALRELLVEKLEEEQSERDMRREAAVLKKLGMIPRDLDYRAALLDVLTEQIAGFYDQKEDELNIVVGVPLDLQRPAMAHEIFHAIQDQHFDLTRMMEPFSIREHGDFHLARSALVEGDATILMIDYSLYRNGTLPRSEIRSIVDIPMMAKMLEQLQYGELGALEKLESGGSGAPKGTSDGSDDPTGSGNPPGMAGSALDEAPAIIRRSLIFPYLSGMKFVIGLRSGSSWKQFDRIYDNPPVSTEQILHPDRYVEGDEPVVLNYDPSPVLESYEPIYNTVFGEFQMRLFLQQHAKPATERSGDRSIDPVEAAAGWDGDRLYAFQNDAGRVLLTHLSVWDTTRDAVEYYNTLVELNGRRFSEATSHTVSGKHGSATCFRSEQDPGPERIYVERWGDAVLHIEGAPTDVEKGREQDPTTYLLREQIWDSLDRRPFREVYRERMADHDTNDG